VAVLSHATLARKVARDSRGASFIFASGLTTENPEHGLSQPILAIAAPNDLLLEEQA
jgi:hypothetical protein